jgi:hypothetical protein
MADIKAVEGRGLRTDHLSGLTSSGSDMNGNRNGEIPGLGSEWSCARFGQPGHNYQACGTCLDNFNAWWERDGRKGGKR